jgi:hypothetical protein
MRKTLNHNRAIDRLDGNCHIFRASLRLMGDKTKPKEPDESKALVACAFAMTVRLSFCP